ncbi:MAG: MFS transporter [Prevotella sp.]|nr:MFS transporter [Paraprevotella sp.]MCI6201286.1 MFS transporter [Paraprevotella sp.]MDD7692218.1 MFS transporter [Prevotella sp.]
MKNKNFPFYDWVPKPLGIIFLMLLFIPIMTVSGAYSANSSEMVGGLGILSEHISFIGFCTSIGMAAFSPFFYDLVCIRREKFMCLVGFIILSLLSFVCANTDSIFLIATCSLVMGFVRQTLLMCNLFTLIKYAFGIEATINVTPGNEPTDEKGWDALDKEKTTSMPTIYFFFMILGQIGTWLTAWFAYHYEWQYVYYFMMGAMLLAVIIIMFTMPFNGYEGGKIPITFSKFGNVTVFSLMCCSFIFIMVYGKVLDWYDHPYIRWATLICIVFTTLFVWLEKTQRSPYFLLSAFRLKSIQGGILLFFGLMILNSSQMFVNIFVGVGMKIDNYQNAVLGNWVLVGYFLGLVMAVISSAKGISLKWLFFLGFVFIGLAALYMYFEVQTAGLYDRMKWPVIIRATGMMLLYSVTAVYANQRMPYKFLSTWVCIMLTVRMIVAPGIGSALYSNVLQYRQQYYITRYSHDYNRTETSTDATYKQTIRGMKAQGRSDAEAETMAAMSLKGNVQVQATLSAVKEMAGWTFYACFACAGIVIAVPWTKRRLDAIRT